MIRHLKGLFRRYEGMSGKTLEEDSEHILDYVERKREASQSQDPGDGNRRDAEVRGYRSMEWETGTPKRPRRTAIMLFTQ